MKPPAPVIMQLSLDTSWEAMFLCDLGHEEIYDVFRFAKNLTVLEQAASLICLIIIIVIVVWLRTPNLFPNNVITERKPNVGDLKRGTPGRGGVRYFEPHVLQRPTLRTLLQPSYLSFTVFYIELLCFLLHHQYTHFYSYTPSACRMSSSPPHTLSFSDLKRHNTNSDCWIAVHSKIYDITNYIDSHPGGSSSLFHPKQPQNDVTYPSKSYSGMLEATPQQPTMKSMLQAL